MSGSRSFIVKSLARVEGEGALRVRVDEDGIGITEFNIYEPPRFFEKILVGRAVDEVPDLVARICGICPVAYQMTACRALETALEVVPPPRCRGAAASSLLWRVDPEPCPPCPSPPRPRLSRL